MPYQPHWYVCSVCGWKGYTDTAVCERCPEPEIPKCDECGVEFGSGWKQATRSYSADGDLCEDCADEDGVTHTTFNRTKVRTARRDHKDGRVKKGDRYKVHTYGGYTIGEGRWFSETKTILQRAEATP